MPAYGTPPTQVRLTADDKRKIRAIAEAYSLGTLAETLRFVIDRFFDGLPESLKNNPQNPDSPS